MKNTPVKPITPFLLEEAEDLANRAGLLEQQIVNRIHFIMTSIFSLFNKKRAYWYFYGAGEGEVGNLWDNIDKLQVNVIIDECPGDAMVILLKDSSEWSLDDGFPTRWLYEDFEDELVDGKAKYELKEVQWKAEQKIKLQNIKKEQEKLAKAAKSKLSKEELQALKRTL